MYDSIPSLPTKGQASLKNRFFELLLGKNSGIPFFPQGFPPFWSSQPLAGFELDRPESPKKHYIWTNTFCWDTNFEVPKKTHCSFWPNLLLPIILPNFGPEVFSLNLQSCRKDPAVSPWRISLPLRRGERKASSFFNKEKREQTNKQFFICVFQLHDSKSLHKKCCFTKLPLNMVVGYQEKNRNKQIWVKCFMLQARVLEGQFPCKQSCWNGAKA